MEISDELKEKIKNLAEKYENAAFTQGDPSCILKRYKNVDDTECAALTAAVLAFGRRDAFLKKINELLNTADTFGGPAQWLKNGDYRKSFIPKGICCDKKFYRFYSYADFVDFFDVLHDILHTNATLGEYFAERRSGKNLAEVICDTFNNCKVIPHGKNSANKRVHMFLRWMIRRNSPVDLGIWDWYSPADLVIPMDTHVIQESIKLGLLPPQSSGTLKNALLLTTVLKQIWPDDPCKGDFALFGSGVD